jgi:hypothetical protein
MDQINMIVHYREHRLREAMASKVAREVSKKKSGSRSGEGENTALTDFFGGGGFF